QQGRFHRIAEIQLRKRLEQGDAESVEILEALSVGCVVNYRFADAHGYLSKWLELTPDNFQALVWRSTVKDRLSDMPGARADAVRAAELAPANFSAELNLGQVLLKLTEFQEAEQVFERLRERYPRDPLVAIGMAQAKSKVKPDGVEAARILDDLL